MKNCHDQSFKLTTSAESQTFSLLPFPKIHFKTVAFKLKEVYWGRQLISAPTGST
ncbi:MAG: hypothetical protein RLZZ74_2828 [Cyanobacteriota bacterium]